jgi:hypothetical protein
VRSLSKKGIEHFVYENEKEFRMNCSELIVRPWQKAEVDDWVMADDGRVVQVLKVYKTKGCTLIKTIVGIFDNKKGMDADVDIPRDRHRITNRPRRTNYHQQKEKFTKSEKMFFGFIVMGDSPEVASKKAFPRLNYEEYRKEKIKDLLTNKKGQEIVSQLAKDAAEEAGIKLSDVMKRVDERAKSCKDPRVAQKADETLGEWMGAKDNENFIPITPYGILGQKIIGELADADNKKLPGKTETGPVHGGSEDNVLQGKPVKKSEESNTSRYE